jgi:hypothetical protein
MLSEQDFDAVTREISRIYAEIETNLIAAIAKELARGSSASMNPMTWRILKLRQMGALDNRLAAVLAKGTSKNLLALDKIVYGALGQASAADDRRIKAAAGVLDAAGGVSWVPAVESEAFKERAKAAIMNCRNALNMTNTTTLEAAKREFVAQVNSAYVKTMSGAYSIDQSIVQCCKELGGSGVRITYVSDKGKVTTYSLDAAVRRDIVTSVNQGASQLTIDRCGEYDCDLVEVTAHAGSRPEHALWQGKIYSLTGKTPGYQTLKEATDYGTVTGLCGANCQHSFFPFFPGISKPLEHDELGTKAQNEAQYQDSQTQRLYERTIRAYKRQEAALIAAGSPEEAAKISSKLTAKQSELRSFLEESGRTRRPARERI